MGFSTFFAAARTRKTTSGGVFGEKLCFVCDDFRNFAYLYTGMLLRTVCSCVPEFAFAGRADDNGV